MDNSIGNCFDFTTGASIISPSTPAMVLYYGARDPSEYLYNTDVNDVIDNAAVAYSRSETHPKQYVTYLLQQDASSIKRLIELGAKVYVCGSIPMAKSVSICLSGILGTKNQCQLAMMDKTNQPSYDPYRSKTQIWNEAKEFLQEYYRDCYPDGLAGLDARLTQVQADIMDKGYYFHTTQELEYGVRLSWRNASRCIMRVQWKNIRVIDARGSSPENELSGKDMFDLCVQHLEEAISIAPDGSRVISSLMTVMPQLLPGELIGRRIWNNQLLRFAGYRKKDGTILGDPANVELTEVAIKMGWRPPVERTAFDLLPLITQSGDTKLPYLGELPSHVQEFVPITHPEYPEFNALNIKWHAVPAISNFVLDVGGIQYPAVPFNGWYMSAEIASRNLGDKQRYDYLPAMAQAMRLDTNNPRTLWQDKAAVELNVAVLHSFEKHKYTIVDHHTASDSFVRHHEKELTTRGYIPADWVWIVPPVGGSTTQVFHQEMINFCIKPTFLPPGQTLSVLMDNARTHKLRTALSLRAASFMSRGQSSLDDNSPLEHKPVLIYYGSETGTSESYAKAIAKTLKTNSNLEIVLGTLNECPIPTLKTLVACSLIIVTSTFGTGGPPANAKAFYDDIMQSDHEFGQVDAYVFGLGSTNYANFNACATAITSRLEVCGANIVQTGVADETKNPAAAFRKFLHDIAIAHQVYVPEQTKNDTSIELTSTPTGGVIVPSIPVHAAALVQSTRLMGAFQDKRETWQFDFHVPTTDTILNAKPGDHVAILAENTPAAVRSTLSVLCGSIDPTQFVKVSSPLAPAFLNGGYTLETILKDMVDLSAPPSLELLQLCTKYAAPGTDAKIELQFYSMSESRYKEWLASTPTSVSDFVATYVNVVKRVPVEELLLHFTKLTPRLFSLSSSIFREKDDVAQLSITVRSAFIGTDTLRRGLCSEFLTSRSVNDRVRLYISPSSAFQWDASVPAIMIANGTGIAPFRSFWQTRQSTTSCEPESEENISPARCYPWSSFFQPKKKTTTDSIEKSFDITTGASIISPSNPAMVLYYGVRDPTEHLYNTEANNALDKAVIAYSRSETHPKQYVTHLLQQDASSIKRLIDLGAKVYVCGSVSMAKSVSSYLNDILGTNTMIQLTKAGKYYKMVRHVGAKPSRGKKDKQKPEGKGKRNARQAMKKRPVVKASAVSVPTNLNVNKISNAASAIFHQANLSNPNPKSIGNVSDRHKILVVGDGDLSFSLALTTNLGGQNIVATVYDSQAELLAKYPTASANIRGLQITHATIHVGVDATALEKQKWIKEMTFDRILFNFPHLGGATEEDIEKNQELLHQFFQSARPFLKTPKGEIHVSLRNTPFYNRWNIKDQAEKAGYTLKRLDPFDINLYPGYEAQRTHPASFRGEPPSTKGAKIHVFSIDPSWVKPQEEEVVAPVAKEKKPEKKLVKEKKQVWKCEPCKITFGLQTKYNAHINSSKHSKVVKALKKQKK
ncbi:hypothetical protein THRCLA_04031 [Thraustotheca clavata]|uniref:nitric-oxide synthase (NADPH) n=1 Tax=Thraustotheca clavata TaxID=74557 RepID=A0A1W0A0D7_9STRA|nr:hypothetical protein THRCLA_04031 [Thraustotheca clavata]